MLELQGKFSKAHVMIDEIGPETRSQIYSFLCDPSFVDSVIMPDCHKGEGAVIGFTMPLPANGRIIPSIVGVDQSCGMLCARLLRDLSRLRLKDFEPADMLIRQNLCMGKKVNDSALLRMEHFNWKRLNRFAAFFTKSYNERFGTNYGTPDYSVDWFKNFCKRIGIDESYAVQSIGTLGGGNHFIEFGADENGGSYVTIHSGSRNLGKRAADYWTDKALGRTKEDVSARRAAALEDVKRRFPKNEWQARLAEANKSPKVKREGLAYLEGHAAFGYLTDALFCYEYAHENREVMLNLIDSLLDLKVQDTIETVHNYIDPIDLVIRKGAVASREGQLFILPFNMEDGILICEGKSNPDWNCSAPHGAGRLFGRSDAKKKLNQAEAEESMYKKGIYISALPLDEARGAYKKAEVIEAAIEPTARIVHRIKPLLVLKSKE
jgi:RNA-splicing ligase RtcB